METGLIMVTATLRLATPLVLASMGALVAERSGVIMIAVEGIMTIGALAAAISAFYSGSAMVGFVTAALTGAAFSLVYALIVTRFKADQIVTGIAFNLLAVGFAALVSKALFDSTTATGALPLSARVAWAGTILAGVALVVTACVYGKLYAGLWLRFAGEHPASLRSAGISVMRVRLGALGACGVLVGLAGATLSLQLASAYTRQMTAGRGFIALAAVILGRWRPLPTALGCLAFGLADALQISLQGSIAVPAQVVQMLPYALALLVLAGNI